MLLKQEIDSWSPHETFLVVDDAFKNGNRLRRYVENLRAISPKSKGYYLAAICRPQMLQQWVNLQSTWTNLNGPANFINQVILPDWDDKKCPWCDEMRQAKEMALKTSRPNMRALLENRATKLADPELFSREPIFVGKSPHKDRLLFGRNSLFALETDDYPWVYAAIASQLQQMRHFKPQPKLAQKFPLTKPDGPFCPVLNWPLIDSQFSDPLLQASILRAARPHELTYTDKDKETARTELIKRRLTGNLTRVSEGLNYEIYNAAMCDKIPILWKDDKFR